MINSPVQWILQHGWGFDASCWERWHRLIPACDKIHLGERGYFCKPFDMPNFEKIDSLKILVTHSLGLHFVSDGLISKADLLVIIGGFVSFHPEDMGQYQRSYKRVELMQEQLQHDPDLVLSDFYRRCFYPHLPEKKGEKDINHELLTKDLLLLHQPRKINPRRCLIIHGEHDSVVSTKKAKNLQEEIKDSQCVIVEGGGHALPITHAEQCYQLIKKSQGR